MTLARICSECPTRLTGSKKQVTCSSGCRHKRSRRLKRERNKRLEQELNASPSLATNNLEDAAREVVREELRPIIREALNDDVMQAVEAMIGLTSTAVAAIQDDLLCDDPKIRQQAYQTLLKYTVGHPAVGPKPEHETQKLVVNIGLPRPGAAELEDTIDVAADEYKICDMCEREKLAGEFADGSDRCVTCFTEQRTQALELLKLQ